MAGTFGALGTFGPRTCWSFGGLGNFWSSDRWLELLGLWEFLVLGPLVFFTIHPSKSFGGLVNFWSSDRWLELLGLWEFLVLGPLVGAFEALGIFGPRTAGC